MARCVLCSFCAVQVLFIVVWGREWLDCRPDPSNTWCTNLNWRNVMRNVLVTSGARSAREEASKRRRQKVVGDAGVVDGARGAGFIKRSTHWRGTHCRAAQCHGQQQQQRGEEQNLAVVPRAQAVCTVTSPDPLAAACDACAAPRRPLCQRASWSVRALRVAMDRASILFAAAQKIASGCTRVNR